MLKSFREGLRRRSPGLYKVLRDVAVRVLIEYKVIRSTRPSTLVRAFAKSESIWEKELPLQRPSRLMLPDAAGPDLPRGLLNHATVSQAGAHAIYLSPSKWRQSLLSPLAARYPSDAGLKILRNPGGLAADYLHGEGHSAVQHRALHSPKHLSLVANLLHRLGLGPRLYDLVELCTDTTAWGAYVVQHLPGGAPDASVCGEGLARLKTAVKSGEMALVAPGGFEHLDFTPPGCNGNALTDAAGRFQYVDFQNFTLGGYDRQLRRIAETAAEASHFGDRSFLRGGAYLYQSVPGLGLPAKRDVARRMPSISGLLAQADSAVTDRIVLDIGCNVGMMIGQYLALGAGWCHGWDRAKVVPHTDHLLSALGCTRYSLTGGDLDPTRDLREDLPAHVRAQLDGCIVSYLAVRGHIGWLPALAKIPWRHLIYEGHEGEDEAKTRRFIEEFQSLVPCRLTGLSQYRDGDSDPRMIGLLERA